MKLPSGTLCWVEFDAVLAAINHARETGDLSLLPDIACARDLRRQVDLVWLSPAQLADSWARRRAIPADETHRLPLAHLDPFLRACGPRDVAAIWRWLEGPEFAAFLEELHALVEKARLEAGSRSVRRGRVVPFRRETRARSCPVVGDPL